jgi:hypothetical protein
LIQTLLVALAMWAGVTAYRRLVRPHGDLLRELADAPLREMFGPDVAYDLPFEFDLAEGVTISNLRVPSPRGVAAAPGSVDVEPLFGFRADRVRIGHDPLALAAARYRPLAIEIDGARVITHETRDGIAPDFPFHLSSDMKDAGPLPRIVFRDVELLYRAMPGSERLRESAVLRLRIRELSLAPDEAGTIHVQGDLVALGLGQDEAPITVTGTVSPEGSDFGLVVRWDPLELTDALLAILAEQLAAPLRQRSIRSGAFALTLRPGAADQGAFDLRIDWDSDVEINVPDLPGLDRIDARTKEQLQELFGRGALQLEADDGRINIKSLVTEMAGGQVSATGWIVGETGALHMDFEIRDLRLEDPAVRRALGPEGAALYDEFDPRGLVDAVGQVTRTPDGKLDWKVDVLLENASLRYVGAVGENGRREGFPYRIEEATGRVRIRSDGVTFDEIVGFNRGAEIQIVGHDGEAWTGGPTGRLTFTDDGPDVRLTVIARNVPFDERLEEAIAGSEFADMMKDFDLQGVVDVIEIDVISHPKIEKTAKSELRITLEGEQFRYAPFPLPLEDVRGRITMRRPVLGSQRGRIYAFDVTGWAEGQPLRIRAEILEHEARGRLHVESGGIPLGGALTETVLTAPTTAEGLGRVWRWLGPRGNASVKVDLPLSDDPGPLRLTAGLDGASIRLDASGSEHPIEFTDLVGALEVVGDDVELRDVRGRLGEARVTVNGTLRGGLEGAWDLQAGIEGLRVTPALQDALGELASQEQGILPYGMRFETGSRLDLSLSVRRAARADAPLEVAYRAENLDTVVRLADGGVVRLRGRGLAVDDGTVEATDLTVEIDDLTVRVPHARVKLGEAPETVGRFELVMDGHTLSEDVLRLVPGAPGALLRDWASDRRLTSRSFFVDAPEGGPVTLTGDLTFVMPPDAPPGDAPRGTIGFAPLVIEENGGTTSLRGLVRLGGFTFEPGVTLTNLRGALRIDRLTLGDVAHGHGRVEGLSGKVAGVTVEDVAADVDWADGILRAPRITGRVVGGALEGRFLMHTGEPAAYEGAAIVRDFDVARLRDDLAPTGSPYAGRGTVHLDFQNRGGTLRDLTASGSLHVRNGRLGDLPFVTNVFTLADEVFGVDNPPQFETADIDFVLEKEVFRFSRFDLAGPLLTMPGRGTLDVTGLVDLRFTPDFIKGFVLPGVMELPGVGDLLRGVLREELLYAIRIRGDLDSAEPEVIPLPAFGENRGRDFVGAGARALPRRKLPGWFR